MNKIFSIGVTLTIFALLVTSAFAAGDTIAPESPDNVIAIAGDSKVFLTWDASTDTDATGYKIYYGKTSVTKAGQTYDSTLDVKKVLTYTISNLQNGTTYYFAVTAYDAAGNESENYSFEANSKPSAVSAQTDTVAPTVTSAEAISGTLVRVIFSETIVLPEKNPEKAFTIETPETQQPLEVISAEFDPEDLEEKTVLLTTKTQEDTEYLLTVGISIEDTAGNLIESGESDTASFSGVVGIVPATSTDTVAPEIIDADSVSGTEITVMFSEKIVLAENAENLFTIIEKNNPSVSLAVVSASLLADGQTVTLSTAEQKIDTEYRLSASNITDLAGNLIASDFTGTADFMREADVAPTENAQAPEEITNLTTKVAENVMEMTWTASDNSAGDLANYVVYVSTDDGKTYDSGTLLAPDVTRFTLKLDSTKNYTFKVTTRNNAGNESSGVTTGVCLAACPGAPVPVTGPAGMLGLLAIFSGLIGWVFVKRKGYGVVRY
ncbi:fibronectin type III domain-containing protein [Candidatus Peregrinibacteria bacterium]|nr:fibronectin type III domain-containing protein [Candidatus Peregrinibacteria bacterium]